MRSKTMLSPTQLELGADESPTGRLTSVGLFSGIGGFELGLSNSNVHSSLLCEIDPIAVSVLSRQFPTSSISHDIRTLDNLPDVDIVTAGFPCQDLSQAGMTNGISGEHSSIVDQLFRLIRATSNPPKWVILENVPFTIYLDRGRALSHLVSQFRALGYGWAYRIVDAHCSGIPQRRRRLFMVASIEGDPRSVLLSDDEGKPVVGEEDTDDLFGFYWSEGNRGVGWAPEAIPPLKGSSGVSIPTPPAIWDRRRRRVFTPDVRDAERLMGFPVDWTEPAGSERHRLKLLGNAVSVPITQWLSQRIQTPGPYQAREDRVLEPDDKWPKAAWSMDGRTHASAVTEWPIQKSVVRLSDFLRYEPKPLSKKATAGFLGRAQKSSLRFHPGFLKDLEHYLGTI